VIKEAIRLQKPNKASEEKLLHCIMKKLLEKKSFIPRPLKLNHPQAPSTILNRTLQALFNKPQPTLPIPSPRRLNSVVLGEKSSIGK
jgi:hypothetical protein